MTFDRLTLKLVCKSHLRSKAFLPNLGTLSLCVLELFAMYATDRQTVRRTDKSNAYCPLPYGRSIIMSSLTHPSSPVGCRQWGCMDKFPQFLSIPHTFPTATCRISIPLCCSLWIMTQSVHLPPPLYFVPAKMCKRFRSNLDDWRVLTSVACISVCFVYSVRHLV